MKKAGNLLATMTPITPAWPRRTSIGAILSAALAVSSFAPGASAGGDLAPAPPPFTWTGAYVGLHAGWMQTDLDWAFNPPVTAAANQAFSLSTDNWLWGLHLGYQHQFGQWVAGVEFAFNATGDDWGSHSGFGIGTGFAEARINDLVTIGGRLGWTGGGQWLAGVPWMPSRQWLLYISGGYAVADIHSRQRLVSGTFLRGDDEHHGWYLGGGIDFALSRNIVFGIEYQHVSLDTENHCAAPCLIGSTNNRDIDLDADIVRARLSFRFVGP
jgi:outer membrane immunogenic protein